MRVSISGSHSTGKTILAKNCYGLLNSRWPGKIALIEEVARKVISRGFPLNRDATIHSYVNYVLEQLRAERHCRAEHVISDRSLIDLLAYMRTNDDPRIPDYLVEMVEEVVYMETKYFDLYCYLPIEFPLVIDAVRPGDTEYHNAVDRTLVSLFSEYRVRVKTLSGSIEERCADVLRLFAAKEV